MAITALGAIAPIGPIINPSAVATIVIDANAEKAAFVFKCSETTPITGCAFRSSSHTTNGTFDVRLETVSATDGNPTGTLATTNSNASVSITAAGIYEVTFTASHTPAIGDIIAVVIVAGSPGNTTIASGTGTLVTLIPYTIAFTASWQAKGSSSNMIMLALAKSGGYISVNNFLLQPAVASFNINTGTTPDEVGALFNLPFTCRIVGINLLHNYGATGRTTDFVLYNSGGSVIETLTQDEDKSSAVNSARLTDFYLATPYTLNANTDLTVAIKPTSGGSNVHNYYDYTGFAAIKASLPWQTKVTYVSRVNAGGWTPDTTKVPLINLLIDGMDFGGVAGGLLTHPGFSGGMRG